MYIVAKTIEGYRIISESMQGTDEELKPYVDLLNSRNIGIVFSVADKQHDKNEYPTNETIDETPKIIIRNDIYNVNSCSSC